MAWKVLNQKRPEELTSDDGSVTSTRTGRSKKGPKKWKRSRLSKRLALKRKERERRLAAERKRSHGQLANRILAQGKTVKTEKLSYRSFQKCFGRSVKVRAPGMLVSTLERKAKAAGGELIEVPTWNTRLSQFDHPTGEYTKKPLSQRDHIFGDRVTAPVQRDLYSAFLVFCCIANILDIRTFKRAVDVEIENFKIPFPKVSEHEIVPLENRTTIWGESAFLAPAQK